MTHAEHFRDLGILRSSQSAERLYPDWSERAYLALKIFAQVYRGSFSAEDVRDWCSACYLASPLDSIPEPPDRRAWGGIFRKAMKQGIIRHVGYTQHRDPKRHAGISTLWETVR